MHNIKSVMNFKGITIMIENPVGSIRTGIDAHGDKWQTEFLYPYGYIYGTKGLDKEGVDVFIGNNPASERVFIIHQTEGHGVLDEDKVLLGFDTKEQARDAYLAHYSTQQFLGEITEMPFFEFREKLKKEGKQGKAIDGWVTIKGKEENENKKNYRRILLGKGGKIIGGDVPKETQGTKIGSKEFKEKVDRAEEKKETTPIKQEKPMKRISEKLKKNAAEIISNQKKTELKDINEKKSPFSFPPVSQDPIPGKNYYYHSTPIVNLKRIKEEGLRPVHARAPISIAPHLESARYWAEGVGAGGKELVLLRFKRKGLRLNINEYDPDDEDFSGDYNPDDPTAENSINTPIDPNQLEAFINGEWKELEEKVDRAEEKPVPKQERPLNNIIEKSKEKELSPAKEVISKEEVSQESKTITKESSSSDIREKILEPSKEKASIRQELMQVDAKIAAIKQKYIKQNNYWELLNKDLEYSELQKKENALTKKKIEKIASGRDIFLNIMKQNQEDMQSFKISNGNDKSIVTWAHNVLNNQLGPFLKKRTATVTPTVDYRKGVRSYFNGAQERIVMGRQDTDTLIHELGHAMEQQFPEINFACIKFKNKRTKGEKVQPLSAVTGSKFYSSEEMTKKDNFFNPYVGRISSRGHSEVFSMGLEYIMKDPVGFAQKDPEHFDLICDIMKGKI